MKRVVLALLSLWAVALFASCGSSNVTNVTPDFDRAGSFEVTTLEGLGTFTPAVEVDSDADGTVVTISATDASELAAAYLHLAYDTASYTPDRVEFSDWLGSDEQVLSLALTDRAGEVPVGIVQIGNGGAQPVDGSGVIATVYFRNEPFAGGKAASAAPVAGINKVKDLAIIGQDATSVTLRWTESHPGDSDNNGEVNLSDLTNVGRYLNLIVADAPDPLAVSLADANGDGAVTVAELTTIGQNFGSVLEGYQLYLDAAGTQAHNGGEMISRDFYWASTDPVEKNHPVVYVYMAQIAADAQPSFVVAPANSSIPTATTPRSNVATSIVVEGPPEAPSNLNALAGDLIGNGKVRLTWLPSPTGDVSSQTGDIVSYEIERKTVNPDTPFALVATAAGNAASYVDSDPALEKREYAYRVRAIDITGEVSIFSNEANQTPFFLPPPSPPQNLTAGPSATFGSSIDLSWNTPEDNSAVRFRVYRQGPGETEFTMIRQTQNSSVQQLTDVNLQPQTSYNYYLTSIGVNGTESAQTPVVTATSSEEADIQLVSIAITNGKTTHHTGGSETATEITVVTVPDADSYNWTGSGTFTGGGATVTWKPSGSTATGKQTLSVTAVKSGKTVQASVDVFVTGQTIKTQFGTNGHFIDFSDKASINQPNAPYRPFSYYADGEHVVLFNMWGVWCPPCRAELPDMHRWAAHYEGAYWHVGMNGPTESQATAVDYFNQQGFTKFDNYNPFDAALWQKYGYTSSWPTTVLFDRDGYVRLQTVGMISGARLQEWDTCISEMTGKPKAF